MCALRLILIILFILYYLFYCIIIFNMCIKGFMSENWLHEIVGSSWVSVKSERQACGLEPQAGADPAVLRQSFFLLQEASGFALKTFIWLEKGHHTVQGNVLYLCSDDRCEPHLQNTLTAISSWEFRWITGDWPSQADTENWPSQYLSSFFPLKNPDIYTIITVFCSPLGFALKSVNMCGAK